MPRRSRPLMIAPLIPLLGVVGIFGLEQLHGTRYATAFVILWCMALAALFTYVLNRTIQARKKAPR